MLTHSSGKTLGETHPAWDLTPGCHLRPHSVLGRAPILPWLSGEIPGDSSRGTREEWSAVGLRHQAGGGGLGPQTGSSPLSVPQASGRWRLTVTETCLPPSVTSGSPAGCPELPCFPAPSLQLSSEPVRGRWSLRHPNTQVFHPNGLGVLSAYPYSRVWGLEGLMSRRVS